MSDDNSSLTDEQLLSLIEWSYDLMVDGKEWAYDVHVKLCQELEERQHKQKDPTL